MQSNFVGLKAAFTCVSTSIAMSMNIAWSSLMLDSRRMMSWCLDSISSTACRVIWESEIIWVERSALSEQIFLLPSANAVRIPPLDGSNQLCRTEEEKGFWTLQFVLYYNMEQG